jgi:hypothetical protein
MGVRRSKRGSCTLENRNSASSSPTMVSARPVWPVARLPNSMAARPSSRFSDSVAMVRAASRASCSARRAWASEAW